MRAGVCKTSLHVYCIIKGIYFDWSMYNVYTGPDQSILEIVVSAFLVSQLEFSFEGVIELN